MLSVNLYVLDSDVAESVTEKGLTGLFASSLPKGKGRLVKDALSPHKLVEG